MAIQYLKGERAELLFIKLLLAHSPSLQRIIIEQSASLSRSSEEELRVLRELPRASPVAELKCVKVIKKSSATNTFEIPVNTILRALLNLESMMKSL